VAFLFWALLTPLTRLFDAKARARTPWRDAGYDDNADVMRSNSLPPRRPIFAPDELGAPLMSDEAIAQPALLVEPDISLPIEAELAAPLVEEELATVVFAPVDPDSSITSLIRRLEDGLARRSSENPDGPGNGAMALSRSWIVPENVEAPPTVDNAADDDSTLRQALGTLRRMARG
jgi:hypothetical protein